ncbi:MAG: diaminopimelate epimerase [Planctomycetota bacterium]
MPAWAERLAVWAPRPVDGSGNRFVLLDGASLGLELPQDAAAVACELCGNGDSLPFDGVIFLLREAGGGLRMVIFNADGSRPEACGNALRALVGYALGVGGLADASAVLEVQTDAGPRFGWRLDEGTVRVTMGPPLLLCRAKRVQTRRGTLEGDWVSMGNPHFVVRAAAAEGFEELAPELAVHSDFPDGCNVHFAWREADRIRVRVWERGVGETQACGSGACAVAYSMAAQQLETGTVQIEMPGGSLRIGSHGGQLTLEGPVRIGETMLATH